VETPEVEPQVTRRAPRFMHSIEPAQVSAPTCSHMLEHHVHALFLGELAHHTLEAVLAIIDDVIGTKRLGFLDLVVGADSGDDRAPHLLGKLDRRRADARAASLNEHGFAGLKLGIVEQHMLDRAEGDRRDSSADGVHAGRGGNEQAGRQVHGFAGKAVEMETMHAADMLAQIVTAFAAGAAKAAGARTIDRNKLAGQEVGNAGANSINHAGGFRTDHQRHLALGKCHAAPAPHVDVVERDGLDAYRHLADAGGRRGSDVGDFKAAVIEKLQGAHEVILFKT